LRFSNIFCQVNECISWNSPQQEVKLTMKHWGMFWLNIKGNLREILKKKQSFNKITVETPEEIREEFGKGWSSVGM
jgi:hypothetical protein